MERHRRGFRKGRNGHAERRAGQSESAPRQPPQSPQLQSGDGLVMNSVRLPFCI